MATIAEFTIPSDGFPLGEMLQQLPGATIELERVVPTTKDIFPYFRISGVDVDEIKRLIDDHDIVTSVTLVDRIGDHALLRAAWNEKVDGIVKALAETNVTLLAGIGTAEHWLFEVRAADSAAIGAFQEYCRENEIPLHLRQLRSAEDLHAGDEYQLTPEQHEALVHAFDRGYFEEPRRTTLEELADEFGITRQSVSSRLRRGHRNLIDSTLVHQNR